MHETLVYHRAKPGYAFVRFQYFWKGPRAVKRRVVAQQMSNLEVRGTSMHVSVHNQQSRLTSEKNTCDVMQSCSLETML